jgi:hypothetical protein
VMPRLISPSDPAAVVGAVLALMGERDRVNEFIGIRARKARPWSRRRQQPQAETVRHRLAGEYLVSIGAEHGTRLDTMAREAGCEPDEMAARLLKSLLDDDAEAHGSEA